MQPNSPIVLQDLFLIATYDWEMQWWCSVAIPLCENVWCWGGGWEPIKILRRNLVYVLKLTRRDSLLTRSRLRSYRQATSPQNQIMKPRITTETWIEADKHVQDYDDKNRIKH
jgi:hypothetical protein